MVNDILNMANKYADGLKKVIHRRDQWIEIYPKIIDHLQEVATYLNENSTYKQPFYVDKLHAFNEEMNGTCSEIPSITFRAGEMPMMVTFTNTGGEVKAYFEEGFKITFSPTITGQIVVIIFPHYSNLDQTPPAYKTMAVINEPEYITNEVVDQIILKGLEAAYFSSFTGLAELGQQMENMNEQNKNTHYTNPIGFKRFDTTEKVKQ